MSVSADYRRLLRREVKIYSIIQKSFKKQKQFLHDNVKELYEKYPYNICIERNILNNQHVHLYNEIKNWQTVEWIDVLDWFWKAMWVYDLIEDMKTQIERAVEKWYKRSFRLLEPLLAENWFSYYEDVISNYANEWWEFNLSDFKWAISYTTKHDVIDVLKEWIDNNRTYEEVADKITWIDERLFWTPRARTIAITEMWRAYEYWNYQPIKQLTSVWIQMEKKVETCHDGKVRPEHKECEDLWRVDSEYIYPSVWEKLTPLWINCRCTMLYRRAK